MNLNKIILIFLFCITTFSCQKQKKSPTIQLQNNEIQDDKLPYFNSPDFAPTWRSDQLDSKEFHKIPEFNFKNQLGETITNNTFKNKIYVTSFFFTTCMSICLQMTDNMEKLQEMYSGDDEVMLLSHTVLPESDTVEVLKKYGELHHINPKKWHLVTGDKEKIYELAREAYFADDVFKKTKDENGFVHTENFILIDKSGHIRGIYNGTLPDELDRIQRHIKILKYEYEYE